MGKVLVRVLATALAVFPALAQEARPVRPEVVAVYYPHWHAYDHGSAWKGEGWTEWTVLKAAGFRSTSRYNVATAGKARPDGTAYLEAIRRVFGTASK